MKLVLKKIIVFFINIIIAIIEVLPKWKRKNCKYEQYESIINEIYPHKEYRYCKYTNKQDDEHVDLSIIIPVYNSQQYIKKCIESILSNETKYNYEIICVDDGSTDSSVSILEKYEKVKVISQSNGGAAAARNTGLDNAKGEYIAFIDSDDYISNTYIEKLLDCAYQENCDLVKCGFYRDYDGKLVKSNTIEFKSKDGFKENITKVEGFIWMGIIKRKIMFNIRFPENYWYEDMITRPLIYCQCKSIECIEDCLYYYRQHDKNISKSVEHSSEYKCLSQYFLPRDIWKYASDAGINIDTNFKLSILQEFELIAYTRLHMLPKKIRKEIFYSNCMFVEKIDIKNDEGMDIWDKHYMNSYIKQSYMLYILISLAKKYSV